MNSDAFEMSDADIEAVRLAIADAGMAAIGWTLDMAERDGVAALVADPVPYFARGVAHFRIGLLVRAARFNWTHQQRFYLGMYAIAPPPEGGDEQFILNMAAAASAWGAQALEDTVGPGFMLMKISAKDIIATADKLQSAVAADIANERQAARRQAAGSADHGRGEIFATFRLTMRDN